jgi:predicted kinase/endonuclease/exonuclease/phosphatase family metal-dependent hydrolase
MAGANNVGELSHRLKVLTWNVNSDEIDGGTPMRLKAVVREIEASAADIIFLQEVTADFKKMLELQFGSAFEFEDFSQDSTAPFFVMIMLRKSQITSLSRKRIDFQGGGRSGMGRLILSAETRMKGSDQIISLMTTHLESGKENSGKRMLQYEQLLLLMLEAPASSVQICGGDLNLREAEDKTVRKRLVGSGVDPNLAVDAFDAAGRPYEANCTWRRKMDKTANAASVQARFDRLLFRSGQMNISLVDDSFRLLGLEDVAEIDHATSCKAGFTTPSDHMGILCEYFLASDQANEFAGAEAMPPSVGTGSPTVIVLIGPPGSGKSTLSALLSPSFARISQDALGSRAKCHAAATAALESGASIVVDRCNADEQQRSAWLSAAKPFTARTVAVCLDAPLAVCLQRVAARQGHEGRVEGNSAAVVDVVSKIHGSQTPVAENEGFDHVLEFPHTVTPEHVASELLAKFGRAHGTDLRSKPDIRSKLAPSASAHRPHPAPFSERAMGVQSDSSSDESTPDRSAHARSLPLLLVPALAPSPPAHSPAPEVLPGDQAVASDNDCVLVQHVPPRP